MEASLFGSILFVISCILLFIGVFQYKKSEHELNGVSWLLISVVVVLCYGSLIAGVINIIHIPVNIISVGIIYLVSAVLLQLQIRKENAKQKYVWQLYDFIYSAILICIVFVMCGKYFTSTLQLTYFNSDAAVHFKNAMSVLRYETMGNMYFASLHTALIMEVFMPFVAEVNLYKIFILVDAGMLLLELAFFMVTIRDFLKTKVMKVIGLIITVIYMLGYPLNSFLYSFFYWAMGIMLIAFLLLMLRYFDNQVIERRISILGMMLVCAALPVTYMPFGPVMYIAAFLTLVVIKRREGKIFTFQNVFLALKVFLIPTCLAAYYCILDFLMAKNMTVTGVLSLDGGIYRDLYINFIWTLPFVIYMFIKALREKKLNETLVFTAGLIVFMVALGVLIFKGYFAAYYFYKLYFPLWLFSFVLTTQAIEDLWEKSRDLIVSMFTVFACMAMMFAGNVELTLQYSGTGLAVADKASAVFDIWNFNKMLWVNRTLQYPQEYIDICNFVIEDLKDEEKFVPLLVTSETYGKVYWYEGITGEYCADFYLWWQDFEQIEERIENQEVNYFVVFKDTPAYTEHAEYFSQFEYAYENDLGFVAIVE